VAKKKKPEVELRHNNSMTGDSGTPKSLPSFRERCGVRSARLIAKQHLSRITDARPTRKPDSGASKL
jgi:hypothetical protein